MKMKLKKVSSAELGKMLAGKQSFENHMEGRMNMSEFWKNINTYYKRYGLHATIVRIMDKLTGQSRVDYMTWYQKNKADKNRCSKIQRENNISIYAGDFGNCAGE